MSAWQPANVSSLRDRWLLDPNVTFLNHGSFGACPKSVLDAQSEIRIAMEREPVQFMVEQLPARLEVARSRLALLLHAAETDLVFATNASEAVNAVLRSLNFEAGDEILVTNQGYGACNNTARFVCERTGAVLREAEVPFPLRSPEQVVDAVLASVTRNTRLALIDHVTSITGLVWPIEQIVQALSERGVDTLVDGAHAPGMLEVNVEALGATYYAANLHKWCCAPKGAGALWVRRDKQSKVFPSVISHGFAMAEPERFRALFDWTGTRDPSPWLCIPIALQALEEMCPGGLVEMRSRNRALALSAQRLLCERLHIATPAPSSMIGSLAAVPLPIAARRRRPGGQLDLYYRLRARGFEALVQPWPDEQRCVVRVSAQLYNDFAQYEAFAAALAEEVAA
jgi:isopenicillin-N epimerase